MKEEVGLSFRSRRMVEGFRFRNGWLSKLGSLFGCLIVLLLLLFADISRSFA